MKVVVDASVALKWFIGADDDEPHAERAMQVLRGIDGDHLQLIQPPHFFAEVAAVLARVAPSCVRENLRDLWRIKWQVEDSPSVYVLGAELSIELQHHLFDTLYHAIAIHTEASTLITAHDRYFSKAQGLGRIQRLAGFFDVVRQVR